jgi:hypothetical protein
VLEKCGKRLPVSKEVTKKFERELQSQEPEQGGRYRKESA